MVLLVIPRRGLNLCLRRNDKCDQRLQTPCRVDAVVPGKHEQRHKWTMCQTAAPKLLKIKRK